MYKLILSLTILACYVGIAFAEDPTAVLAGIAYKIDGDGNLWRQKGAFWVEVHRDRYYKNTKRIAAAPSDKLLIVLLNNTLQAVNPDTGNHTILNTSILQPEKLSGFCGFKGYAYFVYDDALQRVRLDGMGELERLVPQNRWVATEGMASNETSMIIVQGHTLHRLFEDGTYKVLTPGTNWSGTTSVFPAADGIDYVITQRGQIHLVSDVDGSGRYRLVKR